MYKQWGQKLTAPGIKKKEHDGQKLEVGGVFFCPRTANGQLATKLREEKMTISKQSGYRIKIVERGGSKLSELLTKSDPFGGSKCGRGFCAPCSTKEQSNKWVQCWRKGLT